MIKPWREIESRTLSTTRIFTLNAHRRVSEESGREGEFYVLDAPDWVNVVAVTDSGEIVLVEQFRHGTQSVTLEIPGGVIDGDDASPEGAARRELLEETGYVSDDWRLLGVVAPNPAFLSNRCFMFLATGSRRESEPRPDGLEEISVVVASEERVRDLIASGVVDHSLVVLALQTWLLDRPKTQADRLSP